MRQLLVLTGATLLFVVAAGWLYRAGHTDLLLVLVSVAITLPIAYLMRDRVAQQNRLLALKEQALRAELAALKHQINPHFFFNTLNNLYGLTVAKSELAPEMLLKLADLMRFAIYEGRKDAVLLRDEWAYLQNYLELQRIRIRPGYLDLVVEIEVEDWEAEIAPLLLILLVENAFKHGVAKATTPAKIALRLEEKAGRLEFSIANSVSTGASGPGGVGLANLRRRLELIYPGRHGLETNLLETPPPETSRREIPPPATPPLGPTYQARLWLKL